MNSKIALIEKYLNESYAIFGKDARPSKDMLIAHLNWAAYLIEKARNAMPVHERKYSPRLHRLYEEADKIIVRLNQLGVTERDYVYAFKRLK